MDGKGLRWFAVGMVDGWFGLTAVRAMVAHAAAPMEIAMGLTGIVAVGLAIGWFVALVADDR